MDLKEMYMLRAALRDLKDHKIDCSASNIIQYFNTKGIQVPLSSVPEIEKAITTIEKFNDALQRKIWLSVEEAMTEATLDLFSELEDDKQ